MGARPRCGSPDNLCSGMPLRLRCLKMRQGGREKWIRQLFSPACGVLPVAILLLAREVNAHTLPEAGRADNVLNVHGEKADAGTPGATAESHGVAAGSSRTGALQAAPSTSLEEDSIKESPPVVTADNFFQFYRHGGARRSRPSKTNSSAEKSLDSRHKTPDDEPALETSGQNDKDGPRFTPGLSAVPKAAPHTAAVAWEAEAAETETNAPQETAATELETTSATLDPAVGAESERPAAEAGLERGATAELDTAAVELERPAAAAGLEREAAVQLERAPSAELDTAAAAVQEGYATAELGSTVAREQERAAAEVEVGAAELEREAAELEREAAELEREAAELERVAAGEPEIAAAVALEKAEAAERDRTAAAELESPAEAALKTALAELGAAGETDAATKTAASAALEEVAALHTAAQAPAIQIRRQSAAATEAQAAYQFASVERRAPDEAFDVEENPSLAGHAGGPILGKEGLRKASLQDIAAVAAAAAAAVAALNHGGPVLSDTAPEGLRGSDQLWANEDSMWSAQRDAAESHPLETVQKLAQMVQDTRADDLGVFDPVDSKGKRTITLHEWYTTTVASTMVGRRESDEDALLVGASSAVRDDVRFKAVFDGHGGKQTAEFCADNISRYLGELPDFSTQAIKDACLQMDADVLQSFGPRGVAGSTGIIAILEKIRTPRKVTAYGREVVPEDPVEAATFIPVELQLQQEELAENSHGGGRYRQPIKHTVTLDTDAFLLTLINVGDSRAMLFHNDGTFSRLSKDHKPNNPIERERVEYAGGFVSHVANDVPRVDGVLALSRAFGDSEFKMEEGLPPEQQRVIAVPDVRRFYVLPTDILVMACDGLFEPYGMDWKYVHDVAMEELRTTNDLEKMVTRMMDYAFTMNSHDNISVLATTFHHKKAANARVVRKTVSGKGVIIGETTVTGDKNLFPTVNEGIFSLH